MLYDIVTNLMVIFIIIIMISTAYDSIKLFKCTKHWLDLLVGILSIVWIMFYVYVLLSEPHDAVIIGQTIVRPMNILTFFALNILMKFRMVGRTKNGNC
jgi:hypothetical protein